MIVYIKYFKILFSFFIKFLFLLKVFGLFWVFEGFWRLKWLDWFNLLVVEVDNIRLDSVRVLVFLFE